jgi:hypothetical protein
MFWLMALFTTCGTVAAMPNALHDVPGPSEPSFGPFAFALGLMGASALLRFVALPRSIRRGVLRAGSFREFLQLAFCWWLALLAMCLGMFAARDIDSSDAMLSFVGLGLLLVLIEVPSRQPSRR